MLPPPYAPLEAGAAPLKAEADQALLMMIVLAFGISRPDTIDRSCTDEYVGLVPG
jgi:hypothetical protein